MFSQPAYVDKPHHRVQERQQHEHERAVVEVIYVQADRRHMLHIDLRLVISTSSYVVIHQSTNPDCAAVVPLVVRDGEHVDDHRRKVDGEAQQQVQRVGLC